MEKVWRYDTISILGRHDTEVPYHYHALVRWRAIGYKKQRVTSEVSYNFIIIIIIINCIIIIIM